MTHDDPRQVDRYFWLSTAVWTGSVSSPLCYLYLNNGAQFTNAGTLTTQNYIYYSSPTNYTEPGYCEVNSNSGTGSFSNQGTLNATNCQTTLSSSNVTASNTGTINVNGSQTFSGTNGNPVNINNCTVTLATGSNNVTGTFNVNYGTLSLSGTGNFIGTGNVASGATLTG